NLLIGGGNHGNSITAAAGDNYVVGDDGFITLAAGLVTQVSSSNPTVVGNNAITVGDGTNAIIGGGGNNTITAGNGSNFISADDGVVTFVGGVVTQVSSGNST